MPSSTANEESESSSRSSVSSAPAEKPKRAFNPVLSVVLRVALFFVGMIVTFFPRRFELWLGPKLGRLAMRIDRRHRQVAYDNIRRCLPELGPAGWERLVRENFEHYGVLGLEILHMMSPFPSHFRRYVPRVTSLEGLEHWRKAHAKGKGVVFVSAHLANWELMIAVATMNGVDATMATRHLKPEWLHKKFKKVRLSANVRCAYLPNALPTVLKTLRKGESFGFVLDQYAHPPNGVPVPFFGVKVDTLGAIGTFAKRYGSAIVPVTQQRKKNGLVHIRFYPEMDLGDDLGDPIKSTTIFSKMIEDWIRANPPQWLWAHRRFKHVKWPDETNAPQAS